MATMVPIYKSDGAGFRLRTTKYTVLFPNFIGRINNKTNFKSYFTLCRILTMFLNKEMLISTRDQKLKDRKTYVIKKDKYVQWKETLFIEHTQYTKMIIQITF